MEKATVGAGPGESGASAPLPRSPSRLSFERVPLTLLDRWLPARTVPFLAVVFGLSALVWLAGFALAADKSRFLANRDWQCQPFFLAAHFLMLRLFVTAYSNGFLAGCRHLTIERDEVERRIHLALGPLGWICALALAAWFVHDDLSYLLGPEYVARGEAQGRGGAFGPADWITGAIWTFEWVINAYIWFVIAAFLGLTMRVLRTYGFRDHVEVVLSERQYKSFLRMSTQGATITLFFSVVNALYLWRIEAENTDYVGLVITIGLLIAGFVPPWLRLKNGIGRLARAEADRLNREIHTGWSVLDRGAAPEPESSEGLAERVGLLLRMARAGHLERLYRDLGRSEGQAMLIRLLAPLGTFLWRIFKPV